MAISRRSVDSVARRAGRRTVSRATRASLDDALTELEHLTEEAMTTWPDEEADAFLVELVALADDVARIVTRTRP